MCAGSIASMLASSIRAIKNLPFNLYQRMKANFTKKEVVGAVEAEE